MYVVKTLTGEEVEEMHSLLKQYHPFIVERHGKVQINYPSSTTPLPWNATAW